jgi:hypothetical protein
MRTRVAAFTQIIVATFILFHTVSVQAQTPAPPKSSPVPSRTFISLDARFSISLPRESNGLRSLSIRTPLGTARGDAYHWEMKEASYIAGYADAPVPVDAPATASQVFDGLRQQLKKLATANKGTVGAEKLIQLGKYPGIEQRVELFTGFIVQRTYLVSRRLYQVTMVLKTEQREFESAAAKVLDSFKVLDESEVAAKLADEAKKSEPRPLPQEPVVQRAGLDATDDGLHGKVKTVLEESQDLSGTWSVQTRKRDSFVEYNEQGNRVRQELYDYKGNLSDITVYGYIDGARVSSSKTTTREYNPPPMLGVTAPSTAVKKSDPRYQTKFEFKYDDQKRLIEHRWFRSNGELFLRYAYKYTGNQLEELVYAENGSLNQRYVSTLDAKGNEIERTTFDPRDNSPGATYSYKYEFDSEGNWTKRTTSKQVGTEWEPQYVDFRTITYW